MQGHNSIAQDRLKNIVARIERLESEKATIASDIKEVYAEAKGSGFDVKALRKLIQVRRQDLNQYNEFVAMLELYMAAVGMPIPGK